MKILSIKVAEDPYNRVGLSIDLVTVFDAILTSRQTCEKLQCLYENLMSNNFPKTAVQDFRITPTLITHTFIV